MEVEHNDFLVIGSEQERDLVFPLHRNKAINSSIAMRVRELEERTLLSG